MTASSGSAREGVGSSAAPWFTPKAITGVAGLPGPGEQRRDRRDRSAEVVGDLLERLAAAVLEDNDLALRLGQAGQGVARRSSSSLRWAARLGEVWSAASQPARPLDD